jgi:hypothetical protein
MLRSVLLLIYGFITFKLSAQFPPNVKEISPQITTQSYLDSTRELTKGKPELNAPYVALTYDFRNVDSVEWIYTEIKVPKGEAPLHTYYCAIGGYGYYCGIQINSRKERRIIFSVWDSANGNNNKKLIPEAKKAVLISAAPNVKVTRFGNEGSGIHTHYKYDWQEDSTYKFLIHSIPDSISRTTTITLFVEIEGGWKMIAKIKRPEYIGFEKASGSFMEDFSSKDDEHRRSASFQNQWVRKISGGWIEITKAYFSQPFENKNREIKDYGCGISESNGFMLSSGGGFTGTYLHPPVWVMKNNGGIIPLKKMPE